MLRKLNQIIDMYSIYPAVHEQYTEWIVSDSLLIATQVLWLPCTLVVGDAGSGTLMKNYFP